jgi:hypothetical protein
MSMGKVAAVALLGLTVVGIAKQEPEIRRYLKIRSM